MMCGHGDGHHIAFRDGAAPHLAGTQPLAHNTYGRRLIIFLVVYNGIVNNQSLDRFVRYNALQAVLLDVLLM